MTDHKGTDLTRECGLVDVLREEVGYRDDLHLKKSFKNSPNIRAIKVVIKGKEALEDLFENCDQ